MEPSSGMPWRLVLEASLAALGLGAALWLAPWRQLRGPLLGPALAALACLPWVWLLPQVLPPGMAVSFSGACLLTLVLGWPLAVPVLVAVAGVVALVGGAGWEHALSQLVWVGLLPASLALGLGAALRRWLPPHPFVYTLGRGFLGTAACVFMAAVVEEWLHHLVTGVDWQSALVARWLMAWGDAFITGMLVAIFVAFAPQWLATWSDRRYLERPPAP